MNYHQIPSLHVTNAIINRFSPYGLRKERSIESDPSQFPKNWDKGKFFRESDHWWALAHRFPFSVFYGHDAQTVPSDKMYRNVFH